MSAPLSRGHRVHVYRHPLTHDGLEGNPVLVRPLPLQTARLDVEGFEVWEVRFPEDGRAVTRIVHADDVLGTVELTEEGREALRAAQSPGGAS